MSRQRDNADEGRKHGKMPTRLGLPLVGVVQMPSRHDDESAGFAYGAHKIDRGQGARNV